MNPDTTRIAARSPEPGSMRFRRVRLLFRKGTRIKVFEPTDRVQEKGILGAMARHGWRLVRVSDVTPDEVVEPRAPRETGP